MNFDGFVKERRGERRGERGGEERRGEERTAEERRREQEERRRRGEEEPVAGSTQAFLCKCAKPPLAALPPANWQRMSSPGADPVPKDEVVRFSDQVPCWGQLQQTTQLYAQNESERTDAGERFQKRGFDNDEGSKFRVTMQLRQLVKNWFDDIKEPAGLVQKNAVWE